MNNALILATEDEPDIAELTEIYFTRESFRVITANDNALGLARHRWLGSDLTIPDFKLPGQDGYRAASWRSPVHVVPGGGNAMALLPVGGPS
ncbi:MULTISPECIES: response regulator transcription factor [unclassified Rhizobium]|uniref:response regulator transcription factor n=1 Tax=unclassified Rhizobium TaxID=2613769 RepID=UPI000EA8625C|nr:MULTISPECIES: response regulator transcription factor [unclassified Rhizobium]AYG68539.1 DNA-binding response regulator [Rhizobium sp. CCGE531]AYG74923.1 DNA-binding response regulator [Rhizobium sp. CCGE532]